MAIADLIFAGVMIFAVVIAFSVVFAISNEIFPALSEKLSQDAEVQEVITESQRTFDMFDVVIVLVFFGTMVGALAAAFLLPTNPVVLGVMVVILVPIFIVVPTLTNSYMEFAAQLPGVNLETDMPYSFWMMKNFPALMMVFGFTMMIVLVARFRSAFNE